jgi:sugar lactone lactonase YvrE
MTKLRGIALSLLVFLPTSAAPRHLLAGPGQAPTKPVKKTPKPAASPDQGARAAARRVLDHYDEALRSCNALEKEYRVLMEALTRQAGSDKGGLSTQDLDRLGILQHQRIECVEAVKSFVRPKLTAAGASADLQQEVWLEWLKKVDGKASESATGPAEPCRDAFASRPVTVFENGPPSGGRVAVYKRAATSAEVWMLEHIPQVEPAAEGTAADLTLCVREEFQRTGQSYDTGSPAYRRHWEVRPVRARDGALLPRGTFSTDPPQSKRSGDLGAGPPPHEAVGQWLVREEPSGSGWSVWRHLHFDGVEGSTESRIAVTRDGRWLSFASNRGFVRLMDLEARNVHALAGPKFGDAAVAFSPDGRSLASSTDGGVQLVDVATGQVVRKLPLQSGPASLAFSPDGSRLAVGEAYDYKDVNISFWSPGDGRLLKRVKVKDSAVSIKELSFSSDGRRVVLGADHRMWIADGDGKVLTSRPACARGMGVSADGALVALPNRGASTLCKFEIVDGATGRAVKTMQEASRAAAISPDGTLLASVSGGYPDTSVRFYDLPAGTLKGELKVPGRAESVVFSGDGQMLVLAQSSGLTMLRRTP